MLDLYEDNFDDEMLEIEDGMMVMPEDAMCFIPCGLEPVGCVSCDQIGRCDIDMEEPY